ETRARSDRRAILPLAAGAAGPCELRSPRGTSVGGKALLRSGRLVPHVARVRCFYHPGYSYPLPEEHPFPMDKFWRAEQIIRAECPGVSITWVEPAPVSQLKRVHT